MTITYRCSVLATKLVAKLFFRFKVIHPERTNATGPALIASNHVSFFDPPLVGISFPGDICYLARKTLYSNPVARWMFARLNVVPVDQEKAEVAPLKTVIRLLKENKRVLVFPEGSRSADGALQKGEAGAGFIVGKTLCPVVPMRIFGAYEALPIGSARVKLRKITIVMGETIHFTAADFTNGKESYLAASKRIMEAISQLECPPDRLPKPRWTATCESNYPCATSKIRTD
jgi:1-acyl-sn-glycerol-3-phosphate acyltransferase